MLIFFIILVTSLYSAMIVAFTISWFCRKKAIVNNIDTNIKVSIIIAFRNEEVNLENLLDSLLKQNYNAECEIILVNDHSEDNFKEVIDKYNNIKLLNLPPDLYGKKSALRYGAEFSKGDILFFTDADCTIPENWLNTMSAYMLENNLKMLCGPVSFKNEVGLFSKIVQLEFLSMTGSGAAGFFLRKPFMCNGANYAIYKNVFTEASNFFNDKYSSGDDVFLLHYVSEKYKVDFIKNKSCIIETIAPRNFKEFLNQRVRWASKTSGYKNFMSIITVIITFFASMSVLFSFILTIFNIDYIFLFILVFVSKLFVDTFFMLPVLKFYNRKNLMYYMPVIQIFYPFYIILTGILSFLWSPKWKSRRIH